METFWNPCAIHMDGVWSICQFRAKTRILWNREEKARASRNRPVPAVTISYACYPDTPLRNATTVADTDCLVFAGIFLKVAPCQKRTLPHRPRSLLVLLQPRRNFPCRLRMH